MQRIKGDAVGRAEEFRAHLIAKARSQDITQARNKTKRARTKAREDSASDEGGDDVAMKETNTSEQVKMEDDDDDNMRFDQQDASDNESESNESHDPNGEPGIFDSIPQPQSIVRCPPVNLSLIHI